MAVSTIDALYHSGSEKLTTSATGITVTGNATFADNGKAIFGAGDDLQIYHDGTHSYLDNNTGAIALPINPLIKLPKPITPHLLSARAL
ncbi:hypothetical protein N9242_05920 [Vicingaceae bacterium]|nr:hypothetical protein [Vicingaceae bacterium]